MPIASSRSGSTAYIVAEGDLTARGAFQPFRPRARGPSSSTVSAKIRIESKVSSFDYVSLSGSHRCRVVRLDRPRTRRCRAVPTGADPPPIRLFFFFCFFLRSRIRGTRFGPDTRESFETPTTSPPPRDLVTTKWRLVGSATRPRKRGLRGAGRGICATLSLISTGFFESSGIAGLRALHERRGTPETPCFDALFNRNFPKTQAGPPKTNPRNVRHNLRVGPRLRPVTGYRPRKVRS